MAAYKKHYRGWGTGSISQNPSGTYRAQISVPGGKRMTKSFKTKRECQAWLDKMGAQLKNGLDSTNMNTTLADYAKRWLSKKCRSLRPTTYAQYADYVNDDIVPALGKLKLRELNVATVDAFYASLQENGRGKFAQNYLHRVFRNMLNDAVKEGSLGKNPVISATPTKPERMDIEIYSEAEGKMFLSAADEHHLKALFHLAIKTGMRQGELLGLTWDYVDFERKEIRVFQQLRLSPNTENRFQLAPVKTRFGNRTIKLGDELLSVLEDHRICQLDQRNYMGASWQDQNLVFCTEIGTYLDQSNLSKIYHFLQDQAKVRKLRFHDLRHTAASVMLKNGISIVEVSRILGHSSSSVTLNLYGHLVPDPHGTASKIMDNLF